MKHLKIYYLFIIIIATILELLGCVKNNNLMYEEDPRIYFSKFVVDADSVTYSFAVKPDSRVKDTVYMTMRIMGTAVNYDREINLMISEASRAKRGYHYDLGPLVMPANAYETKIPVILYRRPGLKDSLVAVEFTVAESKDFKPGYDDIPSTIYKKTRLNYKVQMNDFLLKPSRWDCCIASYLGTFSQVKFRFIILASGKTDWDAATSTTPGAVGAAASAARVALIEYERVNGPLIDEFGNRVVFP